jgi:hypothetical protein
MSAEQNMALVRRLFEEVLNRGNLDVADELLAADFVDLDILPGEEVGVEGFKRAVAEQRALSSDLHFSIEEQIADGDKVGPPNYLLPSRSSSEGLRLARKPQSYRAMRPRLSAITLAVITGSVWAWF